MQREAMNDDDVRLFVSDWEVALGKLQGRLVPTFTGTFALSPSHSWTNEQPHEVQHKGETVHIVLDSIPALPFMLTGPGDAALVPEELRVPLVKVRGGSSPFVEMLGRRSGRRSAVVVLDEMKGTKKSLYRLKGCGNYVDDDGMRCPYPGFPLQELIVAGEIIGYEVRGCSWASSSLRELAMTELIATMMREADTISSGGLEPMRLGNEGIGYWEYAELEDGEGVKLKEAKCCTLFRTLGEKRLGAHLLGGIEELITGGFITDEQPEELEEMLRSRRSTSDEEGEAAAVETWIACCSGQYPREPVNFVSRGCLKMAVEGGVAESVRWLHDKIGTDAYDERWQAAWKTIQAHSLPPDVSLPALLCWRLGRECGEFSRLLQEQEIIWGYFFDHNPFEPHCNSHTNNFVVLPPTCASEAPPGNHLRRFLAAVDFDMAYTKASFLSPYTKQPDDELFSSWQETEVREMEKAIGGEMANSGVSVVDDAREQLPPNAVAFGLRDSMLAGYRSALAGEEAGSRAGRKEWDESLEALVTLALLLTTSKQS